MGNKHSSESSSRGAGGAATGTGPTLSIGSGNKAVSQAIERASKTGVLQLKRSKLKEIPGNLITLQGNLRNLDLSENRLEALPSFLGSFAQLKQLNLSHNQLSVLPDEIGHLAKLEGLLLENNKIRTIPDSFSALTNLRSVNLSDNELSELPTAFCELRKLDLLDLSGNHIQEIPPECATLHTLELNLNRNKVNTISEEIAEAPRLKILRLEENCLALEAFTKKILENSQISVLAVNGNVFEEKDLRTLEGYDAYMERFTASKKKMY